jgi:hypothetical protein
MPDPVVSCSTLGAKKGHQWCFVVEGEDLTVLDCKKKKNGTYSCEDVTMRTIPRPLMNAVLAAIAGKPAGATVSSPKGRRATGSRRPRNR